MISKSQLIRSLDKFPDTISLEDLIDHLIVLEKVNRGLSDSEQGKTNTVEEAREKLKKWL